MIVSLLLLACVSLLLPPGLSALNSQAYWEELFLKHLPDGRVLATFEFTTSWDIHPATLPHSRKVRHYGFFPRSLAEVISHYRVQEFHLSLTQGKWRTRVWGYPPHPAPPGAELWAWFLPETNVDGEWPGLVNAMSGLLCAHLNAIDSTSTHQPLHSFRPQGASIGNASSNLLRYAALPRETVCTENFTPWTKLLPCGPTAGLASLFSALRLYNSEFHSLGLHFTPFCKVSDCLEVGVKLMQTLTVVFAPSTSQRSQGWSLESLFSRPLSSSCPLASSSRVTVDTSTNTVVLDPPPSSVHHDTPAGSEGEWSVYDVTNFTREARTLDIRVKATVQVKEMPNPPLLNVQRFLTGSGHEWGGLYTEITNWHPTSELKVLYLDMVPWFCRVYIHTLNISTGTVLYKQYTPAKDRMRPHTLEMLLSLPPLSTTTISLQFNRAFLKWTEHPPDAHHGFYINSAVLTTVLSECPNCTIATARKEEEEKGVVLRLHTEPLLVSLPTPDFSMPYNVICFVCTVVAIGFGSVFNLTTRTLQPATGKEEGMIKRLLKKLRLSKSNA